MAQLGSLRLRGLPAWLLWRATYVLKIPTWTARVRVFLEWTWTMFFRRDLGYLDFGLSSADPDHDLASPIPRSRRSSETPRRATG